MSKSRQSREAAKALVNPLFAWSNAVLKGGEMMLDSMQAAAKRVRSAAVEVIPTADAPPRRRRATRAKAKRKSSRRR